MTLDPKDLRRLALEIQRQRIEEEMGEEISEDGDDEPEDEPDDLLDEDRLRAEIVEADAGALATKRRSKKEIAKTRSERGYKAGQTRRQRRLEQLAIERQRDELTEQLIQEGVILRPGTR